MKTESSLREELSILGLAELLENTRFERRILKGRNEPVPCFEAEKLLFDRLDKRSLTSKRKEVFAYRDSVIKTGERSGLLGYLGGHDSPNQLSVRQQMAFDEYLSSNREAEKGLPVVRSLCLLKDWSTEEYYLVEPRGISLLDLAQHGRIKHAEKIKTMDALDHFFKSLENAQQDYDPNEDEDKLNVLNHVIRYPYHKSYMLLLTDNPIFKPTYNYEDMGRLKEDMIFLIEHAFHQRDTNLPRQG